MAAAAYPSVVGWPTTAIGDQLSEEGLLTKQALIGLGLLAYCGRHESVAVLVNGGRAPVASGVFIICDVERKVSGLARGDSMVIPFRSCADTHYRIELTMGDGSRITAELGYVTMGLSFNDRFVIEADSVRFDTVAR